MSSLKIEVENSPVIVDNTTTSREQTLLNEIQDISDKITSKRTVDISSIGRYAEILKVLEENRNKFIQGRLIDLKPLQTFAISAEQMTIYMQSLIQRFNGLSDINNTIFMTEVQSSIDKINGFVKTSELLSEMMEHPEKFEWYNKYNNTFASIKEIINLYENSAKHLANQVKNPTVNTNSNINHLMSSLNYNFNEQHEKHVEQRVEQRVEQQLSPSVLPTNTSSADSVISGWIINYNTIIIILVILIVGLLIYIFLKN